MSQNVPEKITTKGGHRPRARIHAKWSPIGQHHRRIAILRALGAVVAVLLVVGFAADAYAQSFFDSLPSIRGLDSATFAGDTVITDRNGKLLARVGYQGNHRQAVRLQDINHSMVLATVAIEDKNFYTNPGFDTMAILRALYDDLRTGHIVSGASTITQQLAKQQFLTPDQTYSRKLKELALAYELSQTYTKDQIMELYLNKSFYGSQSYGVEAAAQSYFHVHAAQLDLAQSAVLAGLPQAPTEFNPVLNPEAAKARQLEVLTQMVRAGFITQPEADAAYAEKLTYFAPINSFLAPHFVDYVQLELRQLGFQPGLQQLNVKTTIDYRLQRIAENSLFVNFNYVQGRGGPPPDSGTYYTHYPFGSVGDNGKLSSGLVAEDPRTGEILVMVGSPGYNTADGQRNYTTTYRNVGSSVKPYTYAAVINARVATVDTPIYDGPSPLVYKDANGSTKFYNYDGLSHGVLPLKQAMANSLNICAVKAELSIGVPSVLAFMRNVGLTPLYTDNNGVYSTTAPPDVYGPSLTLGGYPITLLQHVGGIATLADMGVYHSPEAILQVADSHGNVLYRTNADQRARLAIDPAVAYIMAQIMADDKNRQKIFGLGSPLHFRNRMVAAKTGTSDNFKDAATVAFTPSLAVAGWVGDILGINHFMKYGSDGVFVATPMVHSFLDQALSVMGKPGSEWYSTPPGVVAGPNNSWYLTGTTSISRLPGDNPPSPTPKQVNLTPPPDPGTGPFLASPSPSPIPT